MAQNGTIGVGLVMKMEDTLGIPRADSDRMVMEELLCMSCQRTQWSLCYETDTTKECAHCGKMTAAIPANVASDLSRPQNDSPSTKDATGRD